MKNITSRVTLFIEDFYHCVINEFELRGNFEEEKISRETFIDINEFLRKKTPIDFNQKQIKILELLDSIDGLFVEDMPTTEHDLYEYIEEYAAINSKYSGLKSIESLAVRFDREKKTYKKFIRLKKDHIFFDHLNIVFNTKNLPWKSISDAVNTSYNDVMKKFIQFDIDWLENEILLKEQYLIKIPELFTRNEICYSKVKLTSPKNELVTKVYSKVVTDEKEIKIQTTKTYRELDEIKVLLIELKKNHVNHEVLKDHLPYYGDGTEDVLRKLLSSNKRLKEKIIGF